MSQSATNLKKPQSQCLWYDVDKNKHYLLNNETGEMKQVHKTGDWIKQFDPKLTGSVGYNERIQKAQNNPGYMPFEAKCLKYDPKKALYTPQNNKFEGYTQFAKPRTQPYFNQASEIKLNRKKKLYIKEQEDNLNFRSHNNSSTFQYQDLKKYNLGVSYISGTMNVQQDVMKNNQIRTFRDRQIKVDYKNIDQIEDMKSTLQKNKTVKPISIINDRGLMPPTTNTLQKSIIRAQSQQLSKARPVAQDINLLEQQKKDRINQKRYTDKVQSVKEKTLSYTTLPSEKSQVITDYYNRERKRERQLDLISTKFSGLETKTFDKSIRLNMPKSDNTPKVQTVEDFQNILARKKNELEGFKIPEIKEKHNVITEGRFPNVIPTQGDQFRKDRDLIMKNFAEETEEKINWKKVKQEEMRRDLLRKVIQEQIVHQEKVESDKCRKDWAKYNSNGIY